MADRNLSVPNGDYWKMHDTDVLYVYLTELRDEIQGRAKDETYVLMSIDYDYFFSLCAMYYRFIFRGTTTNRLVHCYRPLPIDDEELQVGREYLIRAKEEGGVFVDVYSVKPVEQSITPFSSRVG